MKPKFIIIHHTASSKDETTLNAINNWHKNRNFPKSKLGWFIGYHYVILGDGSIKQTRKEDEIGAHARDGKMNFKSIGIALTGNFETEKPNKKQLDSLKKILNDIKKRQNILDILGHKDIPSITLCPGRNFTNWINNYKRPSDNKLTKIKSLLEEALKIIKC